MHVAFVPVRSVGFRHAAYRRSIVYGYLRRKVTKTKERLRGTVRVHLYRLAQGAIAKFRTAHRKTRYADGQHVGIDRYGRRRSAADLQERFGYKKAGVILGDISPRTGVQVSLFDPIDRGKHSRLMFVMDDLNRKQGRGTVGVAAGRHKLLETVHEHLSRQFTTDICYYCQPTQGT